ncbi:MAG: hypothetical protein D8M57_15385 [Candidatus Scalindua sp. AMX11]|nr:MAG: hypothetical protein DWQ00_02265 [Candidatus Scalindua sp.]NOG84032.1 hypothetical protein [Planctomycetota bacterium]RZV88099.1 MAG: hypothetical protein EX341_07265 [Candidatus Scalindua sp. SCAELEC01]TDE64033.1 MAG: hypothetical protein D8M57_15385 [Candidatus Scalindua sp. AMX11]GJQ60903.1 MAG: hypothetical protein SCALA701_37040 [Candidatus Scalindua sp.]
MKKQIMATNKAYVFLALFTFWYLATAGNVWAFPTTIDFSTHGQGPFQPDYYKDSGIIFTTGSFVGFIQGDETLNGPIGANLTTPVSRLFAEVAPAIQGTAMYTLTVFDDSANIIDSTSLTVTQDTGDSNSGPFGSFTIDLGTIPTAATSFTIENTFIRSSFTNSSIPYGVSTITFDSIEPVLVNDKFSPLGPDKVITTLDPTPCGEATEGTFTILATFQNVSSVTLSSLFFEVSSLTGGNVLCNSHGSTGGKGTILSVPLDRPLADPLEGPFNGLLAPGESFSVEFKIGLVSMDQFTFSLDLFGTVHPVEDDYEPLPR